MLLRLCQAKQTAGGMLSGQRVCANQTRAMGGFACGAVSRWVGARRLLWHARLMLPVVQLARVLEHLAAVAIVITAVWILRVMQWWC